MPRSAGQAPEANLDQNESHPDRSHGINWNPSQNASARISAVGWQVSSTNRTTEKQRVLNIHFVHQVLEVFVIFACA
jgi:hypothetical protein